MSSAFWQDAGEELEFLDPEASRVGYLRLSDVGARVGNQSSMYIYVL